MEKAGPFQMTRLPIFTPLLIRAYSHASDTGRISPLPLQLSVPRWRRLQLIIVKTWYECSSISKAPVRKSWSYCRTIYMLLSGMWTHDMLFTLILIATLEALWPLEMAPPNIFITRKFWIPKSVLMLNLLVMKKNPLQFCGHDCSWNPKSTNLIRTSSIRTTSPIYSLKTMVRWFQEIIIVLWTLDIYV